MTGFHDLMLDGCRPAEAVEKYVGDVYLQHDPGAGDGREAFIEYFTRMAREYLGRRVRFERVIAGGVDIVLHCRPDGRATATGPVLTFSGSTTAARSSNTGTCYRECLKS